MKMTKGVSDKVFVSFTGNPLSTSGISEQIASFWKTATGKHMNASLMRKSCVSIIHSRHPEQKADLASHMNHALKTAEQTYFIEDKLNKSAKTSAFLRRTLREKSKEEPEAAATEECIKEIFAESIKNGNISMAEVHKAAKGHSFLQGRECSIYFRIRYIIDCETPNLPSLPAECDTSGDRIQRMMASSAQEADEASEPECALQEYSESASVDVFQHPNLSKKALQSSRKRQKASEESALTESLAECDNLLKKAMVEDDHEDSLHCHGLIPIMRASKEAK